MEGVVYRADITTNDANDQRFYHGSTGSSFKKRTSFIAHKRKIPTRHISLNICMATKEARETLLNQMVNSGQGNSLQAWERAL